MKNSHWTLVNEFVIAPVIASEYVGEISWVYHFALLKKARDYVGNILFRQTKNVLFNKYSAN